jgi:DNA primase
MFQSRQAIGKQDECYLVEGYTDVISLHQGGVENVVASSGTSLTEDQLRLIGQLTRNLTILYDGDAAGIKAALRGLDMALSQSFNVQLVLLPDGEDPDSYIQKSGAAGFHEFVAKHKQDVISFRLQVGLKDAGDDPVKRSKLVNEIAESISRINKAEDFALQDHFMRIASTRLKVDETGFVNLVNKYIRDRIDADERHKRKDDADTPPPDEMPEEHAEVHINAKDEQAEWQLLKVLIEYGHLKYDEELTVADHIDSLIDPAILEHPLVGKLYNEYFNHYTDFGAVPEQHYFINYPDPEIRTRMASLLHNNINVSPLWKGRYGIETHAGDNQYLTDVNSSLSYFEYKQLLLLQEEILRRIAEEADPEAQAKLLSKYLELKKMGKDALLHETVVFKSNKYK